jgi:hypothetical protein
LVFASIAKSAELDTGNLCANCRGEVVDNSTCRQEIWEFGVGVKAMIMMFKGFKRRVFLVAPVRKIVLILGDVIGMARITVRRVRFTLAALNPSLPSSSACFSYPIGASSLYCPTPPVNFTKDSTVRVGSVVVVVSTAEGAILSIPPGEYEIQKDYMKYIVPKGMYRKW